MWDQDTEILTLTTHINRAHQIMELYSNLDTKTDNPTKEELHIQKGVKYEGEVNNLDVTSSNQKQITLPLSNRYLPRAQ
jgi:hypothetical protein